MKIIPKELLEILQKITQFYHSSVIFQYRNNLFPFFQLLHIKYVLYVFLYIYNILQLFFPLYHQKNPLSDEKE